MQEEMGLQVPFIPGGLSREQSDAIKAIAARHGAGNVRVFGSMARGDARGNSDVDLLIDVTGSTTPWFPGGLLADLEELLGRRVDIVIANSLNSLIREEVLREAVPL
ncbi:MAG: nucleotidyltransferase family protein [Bryobacteraceae bacterium]